MKVIILGRKKRERLKIRDACSIIKTRKKAEYGL